ncbi:hypothetical protein EBZ39_15250 [bacterium]|nr:hypothetical protein [bacterium]
MKLKTIAIMLCALAFAGAVQAAAAVPQHNDQVADLAGLMGQVVQTNTQLAQANGALVSELRAEKKNPGIYQAGKQFAKSNSKSASFRSQNLHLEQRASLLVPLPLQQQPRGAFVVPSAVGLPKSLVFDKRRLALKHHNQLSFPNGGIRS